MYVLLECVANSIVRNAMTFEATMPLLSTNVVEMALNISMMMCRSKRRPERSKDYPCSAPWWERMRGVESDKLGSRID